jgi:hypothetical protein
LLSFASLSSELQEFLNNICLSFFSTTAVQNICRSNNCLQNKSNLRWTQAKERVYVYVNTSVITVGFYTILEHVHQILVQSLNIKFHVNPFSVYRIITCRRTYMPKLEVYSYINYLSERDSKYYLCKFLFYVKLQIKLYI